MKLESPRTDSIKRCQGYRDGQALVEFAIIAFVMSAMIAGLLGIMVMALGSFQNNIAAEGAGRLLNGELDHSLSDAEAVYQSLKTAPNVYYDEQFLILEPNQFYDSVFKQGLPPINRMLLSSFIYDVDRDRYRHPGAVVENSAGEETVLIPLLPSNSANGINRAHSVGLNNSYPVSTNWVAPVTVANVTAASGSGTSGSCTLAFFYPSQPRSLVNLNLTRDSDGRVVFHDPVLADDSAVSLSTLPSGYSFPGPVQEKSIASASRGRYGLGETYAFTKSVRPFRLVFETATTFRLAETP